jgi:hypothetical protein
MALLMYQQPKSHLILTKHSYNIGKRWRKALILRGEKIDTRESRRRSPVWHSDYARTVQGSVS